MTPERTFPNAPTSVTQARRFVLEALDDVAPAAAENAAVMVSELATNSLRHAASQFTVTIERIGEHITISVGDGGPGQPTVQSPQPAEPTGRGLRIVAALSEAWGVTPHDRAGKTVWFTIAANEPRVGVRDVIDEEVSAVPPPPHSPREPSSGGSRRLEARLRRAA